LLKDIIHHHKDDSAPSANELMARNQRYTMKGWSFLGILNTLVPLNSPGGHNMFYKRKDIQFRKLKRIIENIPTNTANASQSLYLKPSNWIRKMELHYGMMLSRKR
jgi:hypothetical protein